MSAQPTGLTRCGLNTMAALLLTASSTIAEPIYTVTDEGVSSDSLLSSGDSSLNVTTQRRLTIDPEGKVKSETWDSPGPYSGPLPDELKPGANGTSAVATSRAGKNAAGWGFDKEQAWTGFADIDGFATAVGKLPDRTWSQALGVNQSGQVVGMSGGPSTQAFLYSQPKGITPLGSSDTPSAAYAINDSGQVVGEVAKGIGTPSGRAFTSFNNGPMVDLNRLIDPASDWTITRAMDINNQGQIAAFGLDSLDVMHALRLTPTTVVDPDRLAAAAATTTGTDSAVEEPQGPLFSGTLGFPQTVPEPSVLALFGLVSSGLAGRRGLSRRRAGRAA